MIALLQRVSSASVAVEGATIAEIGRGLLVLAAVARADAESQAERLAERISTYRLFPDDQGRMNRSLADIEGELLVVPQFTLAADTTRGTRASFSSAAEPQQGRRLFELLLQHLRSRHRKVETGVFGADMKVTLVNDGPVTFWLEA